MDTVAASGGYITAIAADYIVARGNTITGSIGVIFSFPEISKLLDTLGIRMEEIKSGELKAEPTPYKPMSDRVRQVSNEMVQESFAWFTGLVVERRKLSAERVKVLADGRVYTGRQAVAEKLIDALGGEEVALEWLQTQKNLAEGHRHGRLADASPSLAPPALAFRWPTRCCRSWVSKACGGRSKARGLTVCSCFGTLSFDFQRRRARIMIKSELVQKIADSNTHLYHRDVERIVNKILDEIIRAMKDGERVELGASAPFQSSRGAPAPAAIRAPAALSK